MAMDLIHLVQEVKQKIGVQYDTAVDANEIYEELEQHHVREDRVQFVASLFMKKLGVTSCSDVVSSDSDLPGDVSSDKVTLENKNEGEGTLSGECFFGSVLRDDQEISAGVAQPNSKSLVSLAADVESKLQDCKVEGGTVNDSNTSIVSVPCSSRVSSTVNLPSSSNDVGTLSPVALDFDYDVNNNDPNNNTEYEAPPNSVSSSVNEPTTCSLHEEDDEYVEPQYIDQEQIREKLLSETRTIHTVVPQRSFGEIYSFLESNMDNDNRLQVVMKYFLNQDFPNVPAIAGPNKTEDIPKTSSAGTGCNGAQDVPNSTRLSTDGGSACNVPETSSAANEDVDLQDTIVVSSDSDVSCIPDCESDVVVQDENPCEVVYVDCVSKSGKRRSVGNVRAFPTKKSKVNITDSLNSIAAVQVVPPLTENDMTAALDLSLNAPRHAKNRYHKHFNTVKEMFPNIPEEDLVKMCSTYQETDDDLVRLIDSLLVTVNSVGELIEQVVQPLPELGNYLDPFITSENAVAAATAVKILPEAVEARRATGMEPEQNCIAVFQHASSERDGSSTLATPSNSLDGTRPSSSQSCSLDGVAGTGKASTQCSVLFGADAHPPRMGGDDINKPAGRGQGTEHSDKAAGLVDEVAAIVAATCAQFTASVGNAKPVRKAPKGTRVRFVDARTPSMPRTEAQDSPRVRRKISTIKRRKQPAFVLNPVLDAPTKIHKRVKRRKRFMNVVSETSSTSDSEEDRGRVNLNASVQNHSVESTSTVTATAPLEVHDETNMPGTSNTNNLPLVEEEPSTSTNLGTGQEEETIATDENALEQQKIDDRYECLLSIFPQADPTYLLDKCIEIGSDEEKMRQFIQDALEKKDYPTYQDYQNRMEVERQKKKVTTDFSVESFLEIFPDPLKYFLEQKQLVHVDLGLVFLKNRYPRTRCSDIITLFKNCQFNLTKTCQMLDNVKTVMKTRRPVQLLSSVSKMDLKFLQEVAFIENRALIEEHIKNMEEKKKLAFEEAKEKKELLECACCYNDEVLAEDIGTCNEGHLFCRDCIQRSAEVKIGEGETTFPCLTTCDSEFSLKTLQKFLKASLLSRMLQTRQLEEVKAAGIDGIEYCPYCNFATILPEEDKVFHCLNPECMKESCRLCHEPNHVPKRCDEVEKSDEVKARTYIENKMTEALIRVCWNCKKSFIKEDGCNKMTCSCGAMMCYICRQKVTDYKHFNGQGGTEFHKCPLYSTNDELHVEVVKREALKAKQEVLQLNPNVQLKHDPTTVLPTQTHPQQMPGHAVHRLPPHFQVGLPDMPPDRQINHLMNRLRDVYRYHLQRRRFENGPAQAHVHPLPRMRFHLVERPPRPVHMHIRPGRPAAAPQQVANNVPPALPVNMQPANVPHAQPVNLQRAHPVNMQPAQPANMPRAQPENMQPAQPANVPHVHPVNMQPAQPAHVPHAHPVNMQPAQPANMPRAQPVNMPPAQPAHNVQLVERNEERIAIRWMPRGLPDDNPIYFIEFPPRERRVGPRNADGDPLP